ncbi:FAD-dependent oxidoreductase [Luteimonas sp. FCS-9]|uniref:FAD-dependent oxidoreductase n=1 Tax=Luteimonas sp. FCS-9 TaxID=1547516 RepID=UPI00063E9E6D|nr:FAD-dependent oxidoreductase [Luteimonas sp. FCS-9]KLJ01664.1 FAD-dependent oxidoreductase [Luteimonas sp. FCS-9]
MSTGITRPVWLDDSEPTADRFTEKNPSREQDVVVVGAGVAGLTAAVQLARAGRDVLIVERDDVGAGETLRTTAHLASALDDRFFNLARHHGEAGARLAAASHAAAIDWIEAMARDGIDCDFRRVSGYLFPHDEDVSDIEREYDAARQAGLDVERLPGLDALPALGGPVLRFAGQARVDIGRYMQGLAEEARVAGCRFHRAEVDRVEGGDRPTLTLGERTLQARAVVVATNVPFHPTGATFHKQAPYRSFVVAGEIAADAVPDGLYWDDADPYHYVRLHARRDGTWMLIVGGADHKTGQDDDPEVYARLQAWARARFPGLGTFTHAWSGQVLEPADGLAFLGADPANENVYLVTGDSGNGITHGTLGGLLIADLIQGRDNPWIELYDPGRKPFRSGGAWMRENANAALQFRDWIKPADAAAPDDIARGTGAVLRRGLRRVAVYRAGDDSLHAHDARCPHMGCVVRWSTEEKSWDCPCHGSRFDARTGAILNGPTDRPLAPCTLDGEPVEQ